MTKLLREISTRAPKDFDKESTKLKLEGIYKELDELQNLLYAERKHSVLAIMQGLDASGKDGAIKNVFGKLNPQGILVTSFKSPTEEELAHDFLWRIHKHTPPKGLIQVFNRSHYEDILITRVHKWIDDETVDKRIRSINEFETLLTEQANTTILKFYLHISKEKQQERLQERITDVTKQWKHNDNDFKEALLWDDYISAYEDCFEKCNTTPWTIVPADQNWYKEYTIATTLLKTLQNLNMQYPSFKADSSKQFTV